MVNLWAEVVAGRPRFVDFVAAEYKVVAQEVLAVMAAEQAGLAGRLAARGLVVGWVELESLGVEARHRRRVLGWDLSA